MDRGRQISLPSDRSLSHSSRSGSSQAARYQAQMLREVIQQETSKMRREIQATLSVERQRFSLTASPLSSPYDFVGLPEVPEAVGKLRVQSTTRGAPMIPSWEGHKRAQLLKQRMMSYHPMPRMSAPTVEDDEEPIYEYDAFMASSFSSPRIHTPDRSYRSSRRSKHKKRRRRTSGSSSSGSSSARSVMSAPPQPVVYQFPIQVPYPSYYPPPGFSPFSHPGSPYLEENKATPPNWNSEPQQAPHSSRYAEPRPSYSGITKHDASTLAIPGKDRNLQTEEFVIEPRDPWSMQTGTSEETLAQAFMTQRKSVADQIKQRLSSIPKVTHAYKSKKALERIRKGLLKGKTFAKRHPKLS
mmetsp:Transcript_8334/g.16468  ORF Transcript_8334/g.16468 Transcript_8334/m.16468 type:complete len:356 (-) Transcript_8334:3430-4497(-)